MSKRPECRTGDSLFDYVQRVQDWDFLRTAKRLGLKPDKQRTPRKPGEKPSDPLILSALLAYHGYDGMSIEVFEPARLEDLARMANVSKSTVSRWFMQKCENGYRTYKVKCANGQILQELKRLAGDLPS